MPSPSIRAGLDTLRANPMRTMLSTLGVIMGSASLVAVLSLGDGAEAFARKRIQQEGYNHIVVEPITSDSVDGERIARASVVMLEPADAEALASVVGSRAAGRLGAQGSLLWTPSNGGPPRGLRVFAVSPVGNDLPPVMPTVAGRALTGDEARSDAAICVVSQRLAALVAGAATPGASAVKPPLGLGKMISIGGRDWRVVGVQQDLAGDTGFAVVMPFAASVGLLREPSRRILLEARAVEDVRPLESEVRQWAAKRAGWRGAVRVAAPGQQRLDEVERSFLWFKMLMGAFTAISLIVGGIGIMNVLLASVVERTREIGIRKAVGARRLDIGLQFLTESVAISAAGSLLGLLIGLAGASSVTAVMRAKTAVPMYAGVSWSTLVAGGVSALIVGLVFGTYPAVRASRLSPVDAIQRE